MDLSTRDLAITIDELVLDGVPAGDPSVAAAVEQALAEGGLGGAGAATAAQTVAAAVAAEAAQ